MRAPAQGGRETLYSNSPRSISLPIVYPAAHLCAVVTNTTAAETFTVSDAGWYLVNPRDFYLTAITLAYVAADVRVVSYVSFGY